MFITAMETISIIGGLDPLGKGTYYIKISGKGHGGYNFRINDEKAARPKATSVTKLSSGKKSFKVTAKKVTAKGHQVQYSGERATSKEARQRHLVQLLIQSKD